MSDTTNMVAALILAGGLIVLASWVMSNAGAITQPFFAGNPGSQSFNIAGAW